MNERIQELLEQATLYAFEARFVPSDNPQPIADVVQEKFAELIVRECAGIYSKIDNGNSHMGTDNYLEALHKTFRS